MTVNYFEVTQIIFELFILFIYFALLFIVVVLFIKFSKIIVDKLILNKNINEVLRDVEKDKLYNNVEVSNYVEEMKRRK